MHCIDQSIGTDLSSNSGVFSCIATAVSDQLISHAIKHMNTCERTGRFLELTGFECGTGIRGTCYSWYAWEKSSLLDIQL